MQKKAPRGLKEKRPPPFPLAWGMEMMENLLGLPHSHTPVAHPHFPSDFLPPRENIFIIFPWPKGHRGAGILSMSFLISYCRYYSLSTWRFKSPGAGYIINTVFPCILSKLHAAPGMTSFLLGCCYLRQEQLPGPFDKGVEPLWRPADFR